jgi:uncharacterized protein DUF4124
MTRHAKISLACRPLRRAVAAALALSTLAIGWSPDARASVTRCVGPDGRVSYQDSSCPNGARGKPVDTTPNQGFQFATKEQIQRAKRLPPERELAEFRAPRGGKPKVKEALNAGERRFLQTGLSADEVRLRIGSPDRITHASTGKSRSKDSRQQWIYSPATEDPQTTTVVTVRKGVVTQIERRVTY